MESAGGSSDVLFANLLLNIHDEPRATPLTFTPHNWLKTAKIYNQRLKQVPSDWVIENADIVVLLFSSKGADRHGIIEKFQETYEQAKYVNLPVEVLNVPLDESPKDAQKSYENQANWFSLLFNDPLIPVLKYMYGISCVPYIYVLRPTCEVVSSNGIQDLDDYGKNAIMSWMPATILLNKVRKFTEEVDYYGSYWKYLGHGEKHDNHTKVDDDGNPVETQETQEVTPDVSQSVTQEITRETQTTSHIVFHTASKKDLEEKLKEELKNLHYSC